MSEQMLFRNVMGITPGSLDPFRKAVKEAIEFVERNAPQLMVRTYIDERQMRAVSFQLYRNSQDVLRHWELSDPYIRNVGGNCTVESFEVYGEPSEEVLAGLVRVFPDGRLCVMGPLAGFSRF
ncbi:hypothetical protein [Pelagerythrobacter rhizovicinus]|uniref:ABM domain-containing protein n=1 Tax=Pelagerythrobacter rhizovicinus TaxID=2268576 RepID=A0A4Q2KJR6_9SPHN|nr:hypothetical protein [Pelagerythrobacter rhizovicinus]RXZ64577.1 hypothetical protein ETX26_11870 [Pelagerythrobacter rhizovicinus]